VDCPAYICGVGGERFKMFAQILHIFFLFMAQEVEQHARKLRDKFGVFEYAPFRTHFDPSRQKEQLHMLLPGYSDDGEGQPSSKRGKLPGGGPTVRTYQHSDRDAQVGVCVEELILTIGQC
jgi:hypothetical protein